MMTESARPHSVPPRDANPEAEVFQGSNLTTESADAIAVELGPLDDVVELLLQQLLVQPRDLVPGRDLEFVEDVGHLTQPS